MSVGRTKNDIAWEALFYAENILGHIERTGYFIIASKRINEEREARLMTKFDHEPQLPKIFRDNSLSIQPISRGSYIIGCFSSYFSLPENDFSGVQYVDFPFYFETLSTQDISSESSAINCAYLSGMIDDIVGEKTLRTVSGRMSTGIFDYEIEHIHGNQPYKIMVQNSQCEIDGGFEGEKKFVIVEAKCQSVDDFIVRQLYYPYRLWKSKINKEVVPIFFSFSNNVFTFYVFKFEKLNVYNSIFLESVHRYCIGQYGIEMSDIRDVFHRTEVLHSDRNTTFPQANKFTRLVDLMDRLNFSNEPIHKDEITLEYAFDARQTNYYVSAGMYLGIFQKIEREAKYFLSEKGKRIARLDPKRRNLSLVQEVFSHQIFNSVFSEYLRNSEKPSQKKIVEIMSRNLSGLNETTIARRAQTVEKWLEWILQLTSI